MTWILNWQIGAARETQHPAEHRLNPSIQSKCIQLGVNKTTSTKKIINLMGIELGEEETERMK